LRRLRKPELGVKEVESRVVDSLLACVNGELCHDRNPLLVIRRAYLLEAGEDRCGLKRGTWKGLVVIRNVPENSQASEAAARCLPTIA
jgi:hypothetical protein